VSPPLSGSGAAFPTFTAWIGWLPAWTARSVERFEFSPLTLLAAATSRDGRPAGSRPAAKPQEKAVIPLLRKKNLRSMFDCGIVSESPLTIFDRPITYTRVSSNAIIPLGFVRAVPHGAGKPCALRSFHERKETDLRSGARLGEIACGLRVQPEGQRFLETADFRIFWVVSATRSPMRVVDVGRDLPGSSAVRTPRFKIRSIACSMADAAVSICNE